MKNVLVVIAISMFLSKIMPTDLFFLIENGDFVTLTQAINQDSSLIESIDDSYETLLHRACSQKQEKFLAYLINTTVAQDKIHLFYVQSSIGALPLHYAVFSEDTAIVSLMAHAIVQYDSAKSLNLPDRSGWSALHWAAYGGFQEIIKILVDAGADCLIEDNNGNTPQAYAQKRGHVEIVHYFNQCRGGQSARK